MTEPTDLPLSQRVHAAAQLMADGAPVPGVENFAHLDVPTPGAAHPEEPLADPPPAEPRWDPAAFDALPESVRAPIVAGAARELGRNLLYLEAEAELIDAADVHRYITDPERYVGADGAIDRQGIRTVLAALVRERPHLGKYGNGPGQEGVRPDDRRRAPAGSALGAGSAPTTGSRVEEYKALMAAGR